VSTTDPHRFDDAAYVLGALPPDEHAAFEAHLATCAECTARVREIDTVPALLAGITEADLVDEPMPDTLLPSLMRRANARHRRQRLLIGSLVTVAAACIAALIVAVWPSSTPSPAQHSFVPVAAQSPVQATATLTAKAWGTVIDVRCHYLEENTKWHFRYDLVAYDRQGKPHMLGDWNLPPDKDIDYRTGTSLTPAQITRLDITLTDGMPVLRLKL
jgi:hypothetical protein